MRSGCQVVRTNTEQKLPKNSHNRNIKFTQGEYVMKKKIKFLVLILTLLTTIVFPMVEGVYGETEHLWIYTVSNGGVEITAYSMDGPKKVQIPNTLGGYPVTRIGDHVFYKRSITSVNIPETVTSIGEWAFAENELTSITFPENLTVIGAGAFMLNHLTTVNLPIGLKSINYDTFNSNKLKSLTIPKGIISIGNSAFSANQLISVSIPDSVTDIGCNAFAFNKLTVVNIPDRVVNIDDRAFQNNRLICVNIPDSVTTIGAGAFSDNELTSIIIGNGVKSIGDHAFYINDLVSVTLGNSLESIGKQAFCINKLKFISIPGSVTVIQGGAFDENDASLTLKGLIGSSAQIYAKNNGHNFINQSISRAVSSNVNVTLNGNMLSIPAYNIDGNNYFKLRDIAMALNYSDKQFDVTWDGSQRVIKLLTEQPYVPVGGELLLSNMAENTAELAYVKVAINGNTVSLLAYTINGNSYFKLRDLGQTLGFKVFWDGVINTIYIVTKPDTYTIQFEVFLTGSDLPVTDAVIIFDGIAHTAGDYIFTDIAPGNYIYEVHHGKNTWARGSNFIVTGDCTVRDEQNIVYDFTAQDILILGNQLVGLNYGEITDLFGNQYEVINSTSAILGQDQNFIPVVEMVFYGFACFYQTSLTQLTEQTSLTGFEIFFPDIVLPLGIHPFTTKDELMNRFDNMDFINYRLDNTSQAARDIHQILNTYHNEEYYYASPEAVILYGDPSITEGKPNGLVILINEDKTIERIIFGTLVK